MRTMRYVSPPATRGFSLVELSIVLVILGLLVGGVLAGKSLIRASELRSITNQFQHFMAAHNTFREKYFAIPGDMANATQFWGAASSVSVAACVSALVAGVTGTETCDGGGNGYVDVAGPAPAERAFYWQHLSNAGLITGKYSWHPYANVDGTGSCCVERAHNSVAGKIGNSLWGPRYLNGTPFQYAFFFEGYRDILTSAEMFTIDLKFDDGKPNNGKVRGASFLGVGVCRPSTASSVDYLLTDSGLSCYPTFYSGS